MAVNLTSRNVNNNEEPSSYVPFSIDFNSIAVTNLTIPPFTSGAPARVYTFDVANLGITNLSRVRSLYLAFQAYPDAGFTGEIGELDLYVPDSGQIVTLGFTATQTRLVGVLPIISNGSTKIIFAKIIDSPSSPSVQVLGNLIATNDVIPPFMHGMGRQFLA